MMKLGIKWNWMISCWLLICLAKNLTGIPQRINWTPSEFNNDGISFMELEKKSESIVKNKEYSLFNSPYESIDKFQIEQRKDIIKNIPNNNEYKINSYDDYINKYRNNEQKFYYQNLLKVTENPLNKINKIQNQATYNIFSQDKENYYKDYLSLDDDDDDKEIFNVEQYKKEKIISNDENLKNFTTTDEKIADFINELLNKDSNYEKNFNVLKTLNSLDDEMIAEASIPEEFKRKVRQVKGQRPGFFWTLARLAFEKVNDTKSAVNQIGNIINESIQPELPSSSIPISTSTTTTTTTTANSLNDESTTSLNMSENLSTATTTTTTTTTEIPFRLTRPVLQGIVRRNLKGLIRLFNIEWQDALNQSRVSVKEFNRDLGNQIRPYLEDDPNVKLK